MKKLLVLLGAVFVILFAQSSYAERVVYDTFEMSTLEFFDVEGAFWVYDVVGDIESTIDIRREVRTNYRILSTKPSIEYGLSAGYDAYALFTGVSTGVQDVHWGQQTQIRYISDEPLKNLSFSFKYINKRGFGGFIRAHVGFLNPDGSWDWNAVVDGSGFGWRERPSSLAERRWVHKAITVETIRSIADGRPINTIILQEWDITNDNSGAFFDDVEIHADNNQATTRGVVPPESTSVFAACPVEVEYIGKDAAYNHQLYFENEQRLLFETNTTPIGSRIFIGDYRHGSELIFRLYVHNTGKSFYSGPAVRNEDNVQHVKIIKIDDETIEVWFEDIDASNSGYDGDFNDVGFRIYGVVAQ